MDMKLEVVVVPVTDVDRVQAVLQGVGLAEDADFVADESFRSTHPDGNGWIVQEITTRLPGRD